MSVQIDSKQLEKLKILLSVMSEAEWEPLLDAIGQQQEDSARRRIFDTKKSALDGAKWANWSEKYAKTRGPQHSLLRDTGALSDSMTHVVDGDSVLVGSNLVYAATHLFGDPDRSIPARPYLSDSISDPFDREEINDLINDYLEEMFVK